MVSQKELLEEAIVRQKVSQAAAKAASKVARSGEGGDLTPSP